VSEVRNRIETRRRQIARLFKKRQTALRLGEVDVASDLKAAAKPLAQANRCDRITLCDRARKEFDVDERLVRDES
jgi:hypothetical protein